MAPHSISIPLALLVVITMTTVLAYSDDPSYSYAVPGMEDCTDKKGVVCSRRGNCRSNKCFCGMAFYGALCQHSMAGKCEETKDCVRCSNFRSGPLASGRQCEIQCFRRPDAIIAGIRVVKKLENPINCTHVDDDGCVFRYGLLASQMNKDRVDIELARDKECPF